MYRSAGEVEADGEGGRKGEVHAPARNSLHVQEVYEAKKVGENPNEIKMTIWPCSSEYF
jgi:hypothetical protein